LWRTKKINYASRTKKQSTGKLKGKKKTSHQKIDRKISVDAKKRDKNPKWVEKGKSRR